MNTEIRLEDLTNIIKDINSNYDQLIQESLVLKVFQIIKNELENSESELISKNASLFTSSLNLDFLLSISKEYTPEDVTEFANNLSGFVNNYISTLVNDVGIKDVKSISNMISKIGFIEK